MNSFFGNSGPEGQGMKKGSERNIEKFSKYFAPLISGMGMRYAINKNPKNLDKIIAPAELFSKVEIGDIKPLYIKTFHVPGLDDVETQRLPRFNCKTKQPNTEKGKKRLINEHIQIFKKRPFYYWIMTETGWNCFGAFSDIDKKYWTTAWRFSKRNVDRVQVKSSYFNDLNASHFLTAKEVSDKIKQTVTQFYNNETE